MEVSTLLELFDGICEVFNTVLLSLVSSFSAISVNKVCIYLVSSIKITGKKISNIQNKTNQSQKDLKHSQPHQIKPESPKKLRTPQFKTSHYRRRMWQSY